MRTIEERINWINEQIPETEPKLTYYECGEVDYLLAWPEPDDNEWETGERDERILALNEYKHDYAIEDWLDGAEHMIYTLTGKTQWE